MPFYTTGGTLETPHQVIGQVIIPVIAGSNTGTSSTITLTGSAVFTSATTYQLVNATIDGSSTTNNLPKNTLDIYTFNSTQASGSSLTITVSTNASSALALGNITVNYILEGY